MRGNLNAKFPLCLPNSGWRTTLRALRHAYTPWRNLDYPLSISLKTSISTRPNSFQLKASSSSAAKEADDCRQKTCYAGLERTCPKLPLQTGRLRRSNSPMFHARPLIPDCLYPVQSTSCFPQLQRVHSRICEIQPHHS